MTLTLTTPPAGPRAPGIAYGAVYDARQYGALGNGVADDTAAIQAAITAAGAAGGGSVYLPVGVFMVSASLHIDADYVALRGEGPGRTVLRAVPGTTFSATGVIRVSRQFEGQGNNLFDFTLDLNGMNGVANSSNNPSDGWIIPGSSSTVARIEICNRPSLQTGILVIAQGVLVEDCYIHDDFTTQAVTTGAVVAGAGVVVPLASTAGFAVNQFAIFDPALYLELAAAVVGSGAGQTVKITAPIPHYYNNGQMRSDLAGLYVGQVIAVDTGGSAENVTLTAVDLVNGTISGVFLNNHSAGSQFTYTPNQAQAPLTSPATESAIITAVNPGVSITCALQQNHALGVCVIARSPAADAIGCGTTASGQLSEAVRITRNRMVRLGKDGIGPSSYNTMIDHNIILACQFGVVLSECNSVVVSDNIIDLSFVGLQPVSGIYGGIVFLHIAGLSGANTAWVIADNVLAGGTAGIALIVPNTGSLRGVAITGNTLDTQKCVGLWLSNLKAVNVANNTIRNCNDGNYNAPSGLGGLNAAGVFMTATGGALMDAVMMDANIIYDDRGVHRMQSGIVAYGNGMTNIRASGNQLQGFSTASGIQYLAGNAVLARDNIGWNPRKAVDTSTTLISSPAMANGNGKPTSATAYTNVSGVDILLYVTTAGTATIMAVDGTTLSTSLAVGQSFMWPAGSTLSVTWSVQPIFQAYGL